MRTGQSYMPLTQIPIQFGMRSPSTQDAWDFWLRYTYSARRIMSQQAPLEGSLGSVLMNATFLPTVARASPAPINLFR